MKKKAAKAGKKTARKRSAGKGPSAKKAAAAKGGTMPEMGITKTL